MKKFKNLVTSSVAILAIVTPFMATAKEYNNFFHTQVQSSMDGKQVLPSVNYERMINGNVSAVFGFGHAKFAGKRGKVGTTLVPVTLNYISNQSNDHRFEVGAGVVACRTSFINSKKPAVNVAAPIASVGYRYQPTYVPVNLRAGLSSMMTGKQDVKTMPYFSIGFNF